MPMMSGYATELSPSAPRHSEISFMPMPATPPNGPFPPLQFSPPCMKAIPGTTESRLLPLRHRLCGTCLPFCLPPPHQRSIQVPLSICSGKGSVLPNSEHMSHNSFLIHYVFITLSPIAPCESELLSHPMASTSSTEFLNP